MLSSVLRSPRDIAVNAEIIRAFVKLRRILGSSLELARKLDALEGKYDAQFPPSLRFGEARRSAKRGGGKTVFQAIRQLMTPPKTARRRIGFSET